MQFGEKSIPSIALFIVASVVTFALQAQHIAGESGQRILFSVSTTMIPAHTSHRSYATHDRCCPAPMEPQTVLNPKELLIGKTDRAKDNRGLKNSIAYNRTIVTAKASTESDRQLIEQSQSHR